MVNKLVYNLVGTVIKIEVINGGGVLSSNSLTETILVSPSGGTIPLLVLISRPLLVAHSLIPCLSVHWYW